jgi:opacity protein-like surface antigen
MKKSIFAVLMMILGAVSANAEEKLNFEYDNGYRWFINAHGNLGVSFSENFRDVSFGKMLTPGANIQIGYNFSDYWGVFAEAGWNQNRIYMRDMSGACDSKKFTSWEPSLNVSYNLTNGFCGYKPNRRHNLYAYAGFVVGITRNFPDEVYLYEGIGTYPDEVCYGGRVGLQYIWSFSKWVGLSMYMNATTFYDNFNAIKESTKLDWRVNAGIGFHFNISKNTKKVNTTYNDELTLKHDTLFRKENRITEDQVSFRYATPEGSELSSSEADRLKTLANYLKNNKDRVAYVVKYGNSDNVVNVLKEYGVSDDQIIVHDSSKMAKTDDGKQPDADKDTTRIMVVKDFRK